MSFVFLCFALLACYKNVPYGVAFFGLLMVHAQLDAIENRIRKERKS